MINNISAHDAAFKDLVRSITPRISDGRAYDMLTLLQNYQENLKERGVDGESYTKHWLKERLKKHFSDEIEFFQANKTKQEIVYSSELSIQDIINEAAAAKMDETEAPPIDQEILRIARHIREDIKNTNGIELRPLDISDICMETAKKKIPKSLYLLIQQIICPSDHPDVSSATRKQLEDERKVSSVAQDVIHSASNSKVKLPKHISLAMAIHHLTGSKVLITLLNPMGHCSSYEEVQAVDTSLALEVTALVEQMGTIIPSNISPGPFIQIAADNNDINEETLDGKNTTHATTIVVYQRKQYGPQPPFTSHADQTRRRRSLHSPGSLYEVQDCSMHGRRPVVKDFRGVVDSEWFSGKS